MAFSQPLLHIFLLSLTMIIIQNTIADNSIGQYCATSFQSNKIQLNINNVLKDLVAKASIGSFATSSYGKGTQAIYGLAQCRGDVSADDCSKCLNDASKQLPIDCPNQVDARIWYDYCFMRYDNINFIGNADTSYAVIYINGNDAQDPQNFVKQVSTLMNKVSSMAVQPGSESLGRAKKVFSPYVTIYALAQCTRDLQTLSCAQCLSSAIGKFADVCGSKVGCQLSYSSCMARYEVYPFYFPLDSSTSSVNATAVGKYTKKILYN